MSNHDDDYWNYVNACGEDEGGNYNFSGGGCGMGCFGYVIVAVLIIIVLALLGGVEMNEAVIVFFAQIICACLVFGWINSWGKK